MKYLMVIMLAVLMAGCGKSKYDTMDIETQAVFSSLNSSTLSSSLYEDAMLSFDRDKCVAAGRLEDLSIKLKAGGSSVSTPLESYISIYGIPLQTYCLGRDLEKSHYKELNILHDRLRNAKDQYREVRQLLDEAHVHLEQARKMSEYGELTASMIGSMYQDMKGCAPAITIIQEADTIDMPLYKKVVQARLLCNMEAK